MVILVQKKGKWTGLLVGTAFGSRFGIVDFDFDNGWKQWANEKPMPMDAETMMVQVAVNNQRANPDSRAFAYRHFCEGIETEYTLSYFFV